VSVILLIVAGANTSEEREMTVVETRNARQELQRRVRGAVIEPGGPGWEAATQAFNTSFVQEPTLVAVPEDEREVVAIVEYARDNGLQVAPQRTGHNAEPLGAMENFKVTLPLKPGLVLRNLL
jgi:hypothetical protein